MKLRVLLFLIVNLFIKEYSYSQALLILNKDETKYLGKHLSILEDSSRNLSIEQVLLKQDKFIPSNKEVPIFNNSNSAYWVKLYVKNRTDYLNYYLQVDNPILDHLDIYTIKHGKPVHIARMGMQYPFDYRDVKRNNLSANIYLPREEVKVFYIRFSSENNLFLPLKLESENAFNNNNNKEDLKHGIFYGIFLFGILFNILLYIWIRDKSFLLYTINLTFFVLYLIDRIGHLSQFIFPNNPALVSFLGIVFPNLSGIAQIAFLREFLRTKTRSPKLDKLGYLFQAGNILSILVYWYSPFLSGYLITGVAILVQVYIITVGTLIYLEGYKPARFYLIATIGKAIIAFIVIINYYGIIPYTSISENIMEFGVATEAILYSLALGDRYLFYKNELEAAQNRLNTELEKQLSEREKANKEQLLINKKLINIQKELISTNQNLKNTNQTLDNFVYSASHDLKAPIANMEGLIHILQKPELETKDEMQNLINMLATSVDRLGITIRELEIVHRIQKGNTEDIKVNNFEDIIEIVRERLAKEIKKTKAVISTDFSQCNTIKFSKSNLITIFLQLINNAIKFRANHSPEIFICTVKSEHFVLISVKDNGKGIPEKQLKKVFGMFKKYDTQSEGEGMGLYQVKKIIEISNGRITVESKVGMGSEFKIFIPLHN